MSTTIVAPVWDMTPYFPSLDSPEFQSVFLAVERKASLLIDKMDLENIVVGAPKVISAIDMTNTFNKFAIEICALEDEYNLVSSYIYSFVSTDSNNQKAQSELGKLQQTSLNLGKISLRFRSWCGAQDIDLLCNSSEFAKDHKYFLSKCQTTAAHVMSAGEEDLAADMSNAGGESWGRFQGDLDSQIKVFGADPDGPLNMPVVRGMAYSQERKVREKAYRAELACWKEHETAFSAAMNGVKGETSVIMRRRKWQSPLEAAVFGANIDMASLDAMMGAARNAFPMFRKYLKAKAGVVAGQKQLDWFDLFAPMPGDDRAWEYNEGAQFVAEQFSKFSPKLGDFCRMCVEKNWIDARPAAGKSGGAFCMGTAPGESRLLQTWKPSFGSVCTLAHELGHAYHGLCLKDVTAFQRETPMTLAETASIFCEQIVMQAALESASPDQTAALIENSCQRATQTVVDISSRFIFEKAVFERRATTTLSATELCDLMADAQEQTYGDGLSENRHPYMWAAKGHYYSPGYSFYNFPYMFGHLFSLGLYAIYRAEPDNFLPKYDALLSKTGLADAATLCAEFGVDLSTSAFWDGSLAIISSDIDKFCAWAEKK